ncbi:Zinc finger, RING-type [Dillenia turbinata]|uniref:RING-type E3 ubiquitin transferase n=1 Tax=Dillenia turbinata TaxID=194707 RepID=A0AAN8UNP3_9MAGN
MDNERSSPGTLTVKPDEYALSGKIMLSAIIVLFAVVFLMACLHIYARWYLLSARRRIRRNRRRSHLVFYFDSNNNPATAAATRGLDMAVLKALPVFQYSGKDNSDPIECAVCLSEFEENETGRVLPKCKHTFHIGCIDMWFYSHSTCPLCRCPVEAPENPVEVVVSVTIDEPVLNDPGSSSGCANDGQNSGPVESSGAETVSFWAKRKPGVSVDVPRRNESFCLSEDESGLSSPASQSFKSPGSRMLSLKRILSRDRKAVAVSPSPVPSPSRTISCCSVIESDIERGREETQEARVDELMGK